MTEQLVDLSYFLVIGGITGTRENSMIKSLNRHQSQRSIILIAVIAITAIFFYFYRAEAQTNEFKGWFSIIWGDNQDDSTKTKYILTNDRGEDIQLVLDDTLMRSQGGILSFNRKYVAVQGSLATTSEEDGQDVVNVTSIVIIQS